MLGAGEGRYEGRCVRRRPFARVSYGGWVVRGVTLGNMSHNVVDESYSLT